jgi:N-methylhydantoinase A/oxoprolinase/acetone carboxylase beta subunit
MKYAAGIDVGETFTDAIRSSSRRPYLLGGGVVALAELRDSDL